MIKSEDFLTVLKEVDGKGISEETLTLIQPLVQVNPNHGQIYQAKIVKFLFDEINAKREPVKKTGEGLSFKQL